MAGQVILPFFRPKRVACSSGLRSVLRKARNTQVCVGLLRTRTDGVAQRSQRCFDGYLHDRRGPLIGRGSREPIGWMTAAIPCDRISNFMFRPNLSPQSDAG
ncbi:unnamed protein product, partial [Scytosiphon promiscuus]